MHYYFEAAAAADMALSNSRVVVVDAEREQRMSVERLCMSMQSFTHKHLVSLVMNILLLRGSAGIDEILDVLVRCVASIAQQQHALPSCSLHMNRLRLRLSRTEFWRVAVQSRTERCPEVHLQASQREGSKDCVPLYRGPHRSCPAVLRSRNRGPDGSWTGTAVHIRSARGAPAHAGGA
jgi:hypothetical protein